MKNSKSKGPKKPKIVKIMCGEVDVSHLTKALSSNSKVFIKVYDEKNLTFYTKWKKIVESLPDYLFQRLKFLSILFTHLFSRKVFFCLPQIIIFYQILQRFYRILQCLLYSNFWEVCHFLFCFRLYSTHRGLYIKIFFLNEVMKHH